MQKRLFLPMLVAALLLPSAADGQRGGGPPFNGPRGALAFQLSDGEPVSFYLEWSHELDVTDDQRSQLIEIRRKLRLLNAPFMKQLDSLRRYAGVDMSERSRITEEDREALKRFEEWARPITDSIRLNNDGARADIRHLLQPLQLARADSINRANRELRGRRPGERPRRLERGHAWRGTGVPDQSLPGARDHRPATAPRSRRR